MRVYVLTRLDLNEKQQFVQAMHALADICISNPIAAKEWNNSNLVVLGVKDTNELHFWQREINRIVTPKENEGNGLMSGMFYEPWYEEDTAVAAFDSDGQIARLLKKLPLL